MSVEGALFFGETLPRITEAAQVARLLVDHASRNWRLDVLAEDAKLVVSELVANAVHHGQGESIRVAITRQDERSIHVAVIDTCRAEPTPRETGPTEEAGRGLTIVDAVSERWGWDPLPWGKRVWAELSAPDEAPIG
ncbi:ATP-binding protein [Streptomyces sp. NBC_01716]|uniref:ATP-binding protein n=1 Tax=Streptomyces sp. NBC_01716 TaxID=2975917 RepID=UPI002E379EE9|nr:ATP-binding protein [Streptomyces sp. NBC_01716]